MIHLVRSIGILNFGQTLSPHIDTGGCPYWLLHNHWAQVGMGVQHYCAIVLIWLYCIIPVLLILRNPFILPSVDGCPVLKSSFKYIHGLRKRRANILHWYIRLVEKTWNLLTSAGEHHWSNHLKFNGSAPKGSLCIYMSQWPRSTDMSNGPGAHKCPMARECRNV